MSRFQYIFVFLAFFVLVSCTHDDRMQSGEADFRFAMSMEKPLISKATGGTNYKSAFAEGDAVGIFAYKCNEDGSDGEALVCNYPYLYKDGEWISEKGPIRILREFDVPLKINFYAYYPYDKNTADYSKIERSVAADQRYSDRFEAADLLVAATEGFEIKEKNPVVGLKFSHALSLVEVNIIGTEAVGDDLSVRLLGVATDYAYNLAEMRQSSAAPAGEGTYVRMNAVRKSDGNMLFMAVVPSQSVAGSTELVQVVTGSEGRNYRTAESGVEFNAGCVRTLKIMMGDIVHEVIVDGGEKNVADWIADVPELSLPQIGVEAEIIEKVGLDFDENTVFPDYPLTEWSKTSGWWMKSYIAEADKDNPLTVTMENFSREGQAEFGLSIKLSLPEEISKGSGWGIAYTCPSDALYKGMYRLSFDAAADKAKTYAVLSSEIGGEIVSFQAIKVVSNNIEASSILYTTMTDGSGVNGVNYSPRSLSNVKDENKHVEIIFDLGRKVFYKDKQWQTEELAEAASNLCLRLTVGGGLKILYLTNLKFERVEESIE